MKFWSLGLTFGLAAVTALPALAQDDQDARRNERRQQFLQRFDKDGDGQLSDEERAAAREAFSQGREGRRGEGRQGEGRRGEGRQGEGRRGEGRQAPNAEQLFERLDQNKDGKISKDELSAIGERGQRFAQADADKDGDITREELQAALTRIREQAGQRFNPEQLFARLDQNKDGKLQKDELPGPLAERLAQADADKDGEITKEEFNAAAENLRGRFGQGERRAPSVDETFTQFDKNNDGKLTKEELPERAANFLLRADRDDDGAVTKDELRTARERFQQNRGEGRRRPNGDNANN